MGWEESGDTFQGMRNHPVPQFEMLTGQGSELREQNEWREAPALVGRMKSCS